MASDARFNTQVMAYPQYIENQVYNTGNGAAQTDDYHWDGMLVDPYDPLSQYMFHPELQTSTPTDASLEDILRDDVPLVTGQHTPVTETSQVPPDFKEDDIFEFVKSSPGTSDEEEEEDTTIVVSNEIEVKRVSNEVDKKKPIGTAKIMGLGIAGVGAVAPPTPKLRKSKSTLNAKSVTSPSLKSGGFHSANSTPTLSRNRTLSLSECSSTLVFSQQKDMKKDTRRNSKFAFIVEQTPPKAIFKHNLNASQSSFSPSSASPRSNSSSPTLVSKFEKLSYDTPPSYAFDISSNSPQRSRFRPKVYKNINEGMVEFQVNIPKR